MTRQVAALSEYYPRVMLPANFRFVGPLHPPDEGPLPSWWDPVSEPPVVAVRAASRASVEQLVVPVLRAFGGTDRTIIIAGTTRTVVSALSPWDLPDNAHFEDQLPWSRLAPQRTVVVSDGDYLHTQHALRHGIPLVVAGSLETDVETAARVAWTGAGIDLRTGRPTPAAVRAAAERVLQEPGFQMAAARIAAQIAATDAEATICDLVEASAERSRG